MGRTKNTTIKKRMTGFFRMEILYSAMIILMSLGILLYGLWKYRDVNDQIFQGNESAQMLNSSVQQLNFYITSTEAKYYDTSLEQSKNASGKIAIIQKKPHGQKLGRQLMDISEMIETFQVFQGKIYEEMQGYINGDLAAYADSLKDYETVKEIETALEERFEITQTLLMKEADLFNQQIFSFTKQANFFFVFLLAIQCISALIQMKNVTQSVTEPIQLLIQKAQDVRGNAQAELEKSIPVPEKADEDLKELTMVFNEMLKKIMQQLDMVEENARIRQELLESRFKELQMQINPHFLFNTLNMAAEKAYLENADETAELLENVAEMFRYSLDFSGKIVNLQKEMEELGNYVSIQEQRYGKRIKFRFELNEEIHNVSLPSLTLQPLVENAIIHGMGMKTENSLICISSGYDETHKNIKITVADNGAGMDDEQLQRVRRQMEEYKGDGKKIGLGNVYLRLKMYFKGQFSMEINSVKEEGTQVSILIPCNVTESGKFPASIYEYPAD